MSCHSLLQRIFPTQGSNSGLLHCKWSPELPVDSLLTESPGKPFSMLSHNLNHLKCTFMDAKKKKWYLLGNREEEPTSCLGFLINPPVHLIYNHYLPTLISLSRQLPWYKDIRMQKSDNEGSFFVETEWTSSML